jgi:hypothetical protein
MENTAVLTVKLASGDRIAVYRTFNGIRTEHLGFHVTASGAKRSIEDFVFDETYLSIRLRARSLQMWLTVKTQQVAGMFAGAPVTGIAA